MPKIAFISIDKARIVAPIKLITSLYAQRTDNDPSSKKLFMKTKKEVKVKWASQNLTSQEVEKLKAVGVIIIKCKA